MQVVSAPFGREQVHYQAPDAVRLDRETKLFLEWFSAEQKIDPVLKSGIAHLWFVSIHPFDDGNGRIARAVADMALARSEGSSKRFYSMSAQIRQKNILMHLSEGLKGKLTTSKYAKIENCSQDTALRDIKELLELGILQKDTGGGRSTSYSLADL